jgi:hypothetical protein
VTLVTEAPLVSLISYHLQSDMNAHRSVENLDLDLDVGLDCVYIPGKNLRKTGGFTEV